MTDDMQLYSWVRGGDLISLAHIDQVHSSAVKPGLETLSFQVYIDETLWGGHQETLRHYEVSLPAGTTSRLKFPDPVWGRVIIQDGTRIFIVTKARSNESSDPLHVEEIRDLVDPALLSIRTILRQEGAKMTLPERVHVYLGWLAEGPTIQRLFGGEALAKDMFERGSVDGQIASSFAKAFLSERDQFVKVSLGTWMWEDVYARESASGKVTIINAAIKCLTDSSEDVRILTVDHLAEVNPDDLRRPGVVSSATAVGVLEERLGEETDAQVQSSLQKVIDILKHRAK